MSAAVITDVDLRGFDKAWPTTPAFSRASLTWPIAPPSYQGRQGGIQWTSVIPLADVTPWLQEALQTLSRFAVLPQNWDSYGAEPPNETAIALAREVLNAMGDVDLKPSHLDASAENGVCLSFANGSRYADIECFNSGEMLAVTSSGDGQPTVWEVPATAIDIKSAVAAIESYLYR